MIKKIILICIIFMPITAFANVSEQLDAIDYNFETVTFANENIDVKEEIGRQISGKGFDLKEILSNIYNMFLNEIKQGIYSIIGVLIVLIIYSIVTSAMGENIFAFYMAILIVLITICNQFAGAVQITSKAITDIGIFLKCLIPSMSALAMVTTNIGGLAFYQIVMFVVYYITMFLSCVVLPVVSMQTAFYVGGAINPNLPLANIGEAIKKVTIFVMSLIMIIFVAFVSAQGIISSGLGLAGGKTVKYIVGNLIPLVGSIVADASEMVIASTRLIKGATGGVGIVMIIFICIVPIVKLSAISFSYTILTLIITPLTNKQFSDVLTKIVGSINVLIIALIATCIMFLACVGMLAII